MSENDSENSENDKMSEDFGIMFDSLVNMALFSMAKSLNKEEIDFVFGVIEMNLNQNYDSDKVEKILVKYREYVLSLKEGMEW